MYDIFKRINTGGTPLNAQEIRHSMSKHRSRSALRRMTTTSEFNSATNGLGGHPRMNDREMALRFAAFWLHGPEEYSAFGSMDSFLQRTTAILDDDSVVDDAAMNRLEIAFRKAMGNALIVFGDHAFRKWPRGSDVWKYPINRALFEAWAIALVEYEPDDLARRAARIVDAARDLMSEDYRYLESITSSTGDTRRVMYRFEATAKAAEAGL